MTKSAAGRLALALLAVVAAATAAPSEDAPAAAATASPPPAALDSITAADALRHVTFLAGEKLAGRASGLPSADEAAAYLVAQIKSFGVEPAGPNGAFEQPFDVRVIPFPGQGPNDEAKGQVAATRNVCGVVRGTDPTLKDEYVALSAHYDHVGKLRKRVFHGADDNASGTTALLEVAQALSLKDVPRPRRSVLVLFVSAEERGLLGSKWFVDHPTVPLGQIVCNLNIDMVGRNKPKEMDVYGNATSPELDEAHRAAAERSGFKFTPRIGSIFLRSDQVNFYEKGIPCLFFTSGLHKDYHTPGDVAAKIDEAKVARAAQHTLLTAWTVANRTERPSFRKMDANASSGPLGAVLDMIAPEEVPHAKLEAGQGLCIVRSVLDGTPAAEAKLQPGDFVVGLGDDPLPDDNPVGAVETRASDAKGGRMSLRVLRGTKFLKIVVKL